MKDKKHYNRTYTYRVDNLTNQSKLDMLDDIQAEWNKALNLVTPWFWEPFFKTGFFPFDANVSGKNNPLANTLLVTSQKDLIKASISGIFKSWASNIANRFAFSVFNINITNSPKFKDFNDCYILPNHKTKSKDKSNNEEKTESVKTKIVKTEEELLKEEKYKEFKANKLKIKEDLKIQIENSSNQLKHEMLWINRLSLWLVSYKEQTKILENSFRNKKTKLNTLSIEASRYMRRMFKVYLKQHKIPNFLNIPLQFNVNSSTLSKNIKSKKFKHYWMNISTLNKGCRMSIPFIENTYAESISKL